MGSTRAPQVAIVGGGIGGLTTALYLSKIGFRVRVFEQAPELREVGAGIQLAPNAVKLLLELGLGDALAQVAVLPEIFRLYRRWDDGRVLLEQPYRDEFSAPYYVVHRADLLQVLYESLPQGTLFLGARCNRLVQHGETVELGFNNGLTVEADLVIGADGIHSFIREQIVEPTPPRFSGLCAYRGLVPIEATPLAGRPPAVTVWLGPYRHFVHYPVSAGRLLNFVAVVPAGDWTLESWTAEGRIEDALEEYEGWHEEVRQILIAVTSVKRWALYDREPLGTWTRGRVTLLGDAAHPMLPFFAQGACQAIEDAAVLARCLEGCRVEDIPSALLRYERIRKPRASRIQSLSHSRGHGHHHLPDGEEQRKRDERLATSDFLQSNAWVYGYDVDEEVARHPA